MSSSLCSTAQSGNTARLVLGAMTLVLAGWTAAPALAEIRIVDRTLHEPVVLDQSDDYLLQNVSITDCTDAAALTLTGRISSISIRNSHFGNITSASRGKAAALDAVGAVVGSISVADSIFFDAQNQLVCLRDGCFASVTFQHCVFKTSDAFLKRIYAANPWRSWPPQIEFYNIDRLELLDNEYSNTQIVIHPSVKLVIFRGDISRLRVDSPNTQVLRIGPNDDPSSILPATAAVPADRNELSTSGNPESAAKKRPPSNHTPELAVSLVGGGD